jgi:tetratricopeptide (TPR) repeat protein
MRAKTCRLAALIALVCAALALAPTTTAYGQGRPGAGGKKGDVKEQARAAYEAGQKKFDAGEFAAAAEDFKKADELYPGAAPKHKLAVSLDKAGKAEEAVAAYRSFIDSNPGDKYADKVAEAEKRIKELDKSAAPEVARVTLAVTPANVKNLVVTVDGKEVQGTTLELTPGQHTVVISADGHKPLTEVVEVKAQETRELAVTLTPAAAVKPKPAKPRPKPKPVKPDEEPEERSNVPAYITLGIAGAGIVLGTVFGILALGKKSDFDDRAEAGDATSEELTELADDAERSALIADMSFGVALTFGITGAVLLFSGGDDDEEEEKKEGSARPTVAPYAGTQGGGVVAKWRF